MSYKSGCWHGRPPPAAAPAVPASRILVLVGASKLICAGLKHRVGNRARAGDRKRKKRESAKVPVHASAGVACGGRWGNEAGRPSSASRKGLGRTNISRWPAGRDKENLRFPRLSRGDKDDGGRRPHDRTRWALRRFGPHLVSAGYCWPSQQGATAGARLVQASRGRTKEEPSENDAASVRMKCSTCL